MDNNQRVDVIGIGTVLLKFTSGKMVTLKNVVHVPTVSMYLVSYSKLVENKFHISREGGKIVFFKRNTFIGKAYRHLGMYRLNLNKDVVFLVMLLFFK